MILVIAGNFQQAQVHMGELNIQKFCYVKRDADLLVAETGSVLLFCGTWWNFPDYRRYRMLAFERGLAVYEPCHNWR